MHPGHGEIKSDHTEATEGPLDELLTPVTLSGCPGPMNAVQELGGGHRRDGDCPPPRSALRQSRGRSPLARRQSGCSNRLAPPSRLGHRGLLCDQVLHDREILVVRPGQRAQQVRQSTTAELRRSGWQDFADGPARPFRDESLAPVADPVNHVGEGACGFRRGDTYFRRIRFYVISVWPLRRRLEAMV
jgi:hypothetical protein